jgi:hypothetical protein
MLKKINTLYLNGLSETSIIGFLKKKEKTRIRIDILWKKRSREAVKKLRLSYRPRKVLSKKEQFSIYRKTVWIITNKQAIDTLENHHLRGFKSYHLDHMISIWDGHKKNIAPEVIGALSNLRFIHYKDNMKKGRKSI